ncbi:LysR family transcriptional regulator [Kineosporia rhizophila]|uniref:LysR family transcriptional regulator n=1 Tax=Kineosporia TaxID=49184 RepID=UPI001E44837D|nr:MULTISPECIES: LysR family transcriptional regulator [Kineosporia]MCE0538476.1 LysR family transcriptional regulator [Kineosporia rhizophila]GLY18329.1 LysR family transcriptional regulator [Kineosporia sp. NBRC 101677]
MSIDSPDFTIDLRKLRLLREIDHRGTVAAAAAALHLTPSAVSQQVAGLSRELGVALLEKQGRGVRLTGPARVLLGHASAIAAQLERARADLAAFEDGSVGEVRVATLPSAVAALLGPAMAQLRAEKPGLQVLSRDKGPTGAVRALDDGEVDIAITVDHPGCPRPDDLRYTRVDLITDILDVVVHRDHPLAGAAQVDLTQLAHDEWISGDPDDACSVITDSVCSAAGFLPDVRHWTIEYDALGALVAAGMGVGLVPRLAQPLRFTELRTIPVAGTSPVRQVCAFTRAGGTAGAPTQVVLKKLKEVAAVRHDSTLGTWA